MHASLMCSGVSKSGSPAAKPQTSSPAALRALAFASTASVGDGAIFRAHEERGSGWLLMQKDDEIKSCSLKSKHAVPTLEPSRKRPSSREPARHRPRRITEGCYLRPPLAVFLAA